MSPQRWGFRFSVRTLFLTITCFALGLAVALAIHRRGLRQSHAMDEVYQLGGAAMFLPNRIPTHFDFCFRDIGQVNFSGPSVSDEQLQILREFPRVKRIRLGHCEAITDRSVPLLKSFRHLESLDLRGTAISDEAAEDLRQVLPKCEVLTHVGCRCGNCGQYFETREVTAKTRLCPSCENRGSVN